MIKSNYEFVKEVIKSYEMDFVLNDFKNEFKEGENISKEDYFDFCNNYIDDSSEGYYIRMNWRWIESGGDDSVFDEEEEEDDEE